MPKETFDKIQYPSLNLKNILNKVELDGYLLDKIWLNPKSNIYAWRTCSRAFWLQVTTNTIQTGFSKTEFIAYSSR